MRQRFLVGAFVIAGAALVFSIQAEAIKIGVIWSGKSGVATSVCNGFTEEMKVLLPDADIEYQKDVASMDILATTVAKWQGEKKGVVVLRSNGAEFLKKNPPKVPSFVGACNNPVDLGVVKSLTSPEGKITGSSYYIPAKNQFITFKAILPNMKNVVLYIDKTNPSGPIDKAETQGVAKEMGFALKVAECSTLEEVIASVKTVTAENTIILLGYQALLFDNAPAIIAAAGKIPVFTYNAKPVEKGALAGFVADDVKLGKLLAQSVVDVLKNGKAISAVPIKLDLEPKLKINTTAAATLGIQIPLNIIKHAVTVQ
jgi:putative ABC transport system substrate-binding protein